jgi:hypothetical protein
MKRIGWILGAGLVMTFVTSCSNNQTQPTEEATNSSTEVQAEETEETSSTVAPSVFGEEVTIEKVTSTDELFSALGESDTVNDIVISGKINNCCQKKGCWMKVDLGNEKEVFVKFKDYGFFMPLDCGGSTAVMQGKAYADTISVDELKHYAEDAGKSEEEIAAITEPEVKYSFMASGVILKDYVHKTEETLESSEGEEEAHAHEHDHDHKH